MMLYKFTDIWQKNCIDNSVSFYSLWCFLSHEKFCSNLSVKDFIRNSSNFLHKVFINLYFISNVFLQVGVLHIMR
ncbi:Hypothetical protein ERWE_CDS_01590 [Ehrlichia ruminantium str. Welgevonden]|uniref:Uncharacterized protein n=1 Tax=Ehrlichia ruminantium (strain Welgevonden) TaxID=254945 RepID=A0A0H3LYQ4_EHRRW|nr:Hypothetical protein ERWE_CDS_01590 [Ehrlichia ruminantium str. Welgevonden]